MLTAPRTGTGSFEAGGLLQSLDDQQGAEKRKKRKREGRKEAGPARNRTGRNPLAKEKKGGRGEGQRWFSSRFLDIQSLSFFTESKTGWQEKRGGEKGKEERIKKNDIIDHMLWLIAGIRSPPSS